MKIQEARKETDGLPPPTKKTTEKIPKIGTPIPPPTGQTHTEITPHTETPGPGTVQQRPIQPGTIQPGTVQPGIVLQRTIQPGKQKDIWDSSFFLHKLALLAKLAENCVQNTKYPGNALV